MLKLERRGGECSVLLRERESWFFSLLPRAFFVALLLHLFPLIIFKCDFFTIFDESRVAVPVQVEITITAPVHNSTVAEVVVERVPLPSYWRSYYPEQTPLLLSYPSKSEWALAAKENRIKDPFEHWKRGLPVTALLDLTPLKTMVAGGPSLYLQGALSHLSAANRAELLEELAALGKEGKGPFSFLLWVDTRRGEVAYVEQDGDNLLENGSQLERKIKKCVKRIQFARKPGGGVVRGRLRITL